MRIRRGGARLILAALVLTFAAVWARAFEIREVRSPGGIVAWLVEDRSIPLIAMNFSFAPGAAADPAGKEGLADFLSGMMDEGSGDLDAEEFQQRKDELAFKMGFDAGSDSFNGSFETLSKRRAAAFDLLSLAVTAPRFDAEPLEKVRRQLLAGIEQGLQDPERIAGTAWRRSVFADHPYGRPSRGTAASIATIAAGDLRDQHGKLFARETLKIGVVGDIAPGELAGLLDRVFGGLPANTGLTAPSDAVPAAGPMLDVIERDMPQSFIVFGLAGIKRTDPDFMAAFVASEILGGSGHGARLTAEVREKRGLTYGIGFGLYPMKGAGLAIGSVGTRNDKAGEVLALVEDTIRRFAAEGPSQAELDAAKTYLTGSYALRFDSNGKIAGQLLAIQEENLGIDYVKRRNAMIETVTLDRVKAQASRLFDAGRLIVTVVGRPEGLKDGG